MLQRQHPVKLALALAAALALLTPVAALAGGTAMTKAPVKGNGTGVAVQYRVDGTPEAGRPVQVVLAFDGITDPGGATVRLSTDGGLALAGSETSRSFAPGRPGSWTVEVVPAAAGTGYLHVFTQQSGATSAVSVPVQVGKPPAPAAPGENLKQDAGGDKILPMRVK